MFYIERVSNEIDKNIANLNITLYNDGIHNTMVDVVVNFLVVAHGFSYEIALNMPESRNDRSFKRLFLRTAVDIEKFLKGNRGNFVVAMLLDQYLKCLDFELKFPLKKVKLFLI